MIDGRMNKFYEEILPARAALREGADHFGGMQLVKTKIAKLGENISVARFVRFKVGETTVESSEEQAAQGQ